MLKIFLKNTQTNVELLCVGVLHTAYDPITYYHYCHTFYSTSKPLTPL